jgi:aminoglycoside phosphotransferase (APT) family kinase protein
LTDLAPALLNWLRTTLTTEGWIAAAPLPARSNNRSFRLAVGEGRYVLKLIHPQRTAAVAHELAILPYLHEHGFPVPGVLAIGRDLSDVPETAVLRSYLVGTPASERWTTLMQEARADLLAAMGTLLGRVHRIPVVEVAAFWQFPEDTVQAPADWATNFVQKKVASDLSVILPSGALEDDISRQVRMTLPRWSEALADAPVTLAPLHGDFYLDNLLTADNGTISGLLDWEAARLGDPLWELARTQTASFGETAGEWESLIGAYARAVPWPLDRRRVACYRFLMAMGDLRYAVRHAPDLIPDRAAHVTAFWRQLMEDGAWS